MGDNTELFTYLLQRHLTAELISTVYYPPMVEFVLANQSANQDTPYYLQVDTIANQLQEAGYELEAGSLLAQHRGLHRGLRTINAAVGALTRWFSR